MRRHVAAEFDVSAANTQSDDENESDPDTEDALCRLQKAPVLKMENMKEQRTDGVFYESANGFNRLCSGIQK